MIKKSTIIWPLLAALGLVGGWLGEPYLRSIKKEPDATPEIAASQADTDSFSIRLFAQALNEKKQGNVLAAPHIVSDALSVLQQVAAGKTLEELQALQLRAPMPSRATEPTCAVLLAMDFNLPRKGAAQHVMPLPFSEDVPLALSLFNGWIANATQRDNTQLANSSIVSNRTKLLAGCSITLHKEWELPFNVANSRTADFDSASGGMPHFHQMRSRGLYRIASAEDGSWKAVALPFKKDSLTGVPLVYIGILPAGSARDFAEKLTAEKLTTIRRMLANSEPKDILVEIPRLEQQVLPYDMRDTLRRMQLKALFDSQSADFSPLTSEKIHLDGFLFSSCATLIESANTAEADNSLELAGDRISFNRPFIWLVADLETGTPIEFIGLVEEM